MSWSYVDPKGLRAAHKPALAQEHSATSRAAAARIEPLRGEKQRIVLDAIALTGAHGATAQELEELTGLAGNTVRPRIIELFEQQRIVKNGHTRPTKSRRHAEVWIASQNGSPDSLARESFMAVADSRDGNPVASVVVDGSVREGVGTPFRVNA